MVPRIYILVWAMETTPARTSNITPVFSIVRDLRSETGAGLRLAGSGGGAVGPPGLAPCQNSGGTPDRTFGQRGLGIGWLRIWRFSLAVARP